MAGLTFTAKKLCAALNTRGYKFTLHQRPYIGYDGNPHNYYVICNGVFDEEKGKYTNVEVYKTTSAVRIVFYLRDLWYLENGLELPTDQEQWNAIREELNIGG